MRKEKITINGKNFSRCRRPEALIAYLDGGRVGMCGLVDFKDTIPSKMKFTTRENNMLYYNKCHELGYYIKWYKEI